MKKPVLLFVLMLLVQVSTWAQCAMCTKTAQQLGEKPGLGLNNGIIYLMSTPLLILGYLAYRWYKANKVA